MAWVELAAFGFVLLMVALVFLWPLPKGEDSSPEKDAISRDRNKQ